MPGSLACFLVALFFSGWLAGWQATFFYSFSWIVTTLSICVSTSLILLILAFCRFPCLRVCVSANKSQKPWMTSKCVLLALADGNLVFKTARGVHWFQLNDYFFPPDSRFIDSCKRSARLQHSPIQCNYCGPLYFLILSVYLCPNFFFFVL